MNKNFNLSIGDSPLVVGRVYKIVSSEVWGQARARGEFDGAGIDLRDGYIHLSTAAQAPETLALHFASQGGLLLVGFDPVSLGPGLVWEPSRHGALFPHLYGALPVKLARDVWTVEWRASAHWAMPAEPDRH